MVFTLKILENYERTSPSPGPQTVGACIKIKPSRVVLSVKCMVPKVTVTDVTV